MNHSSLAYNQKLKYLLAVTLPTIWLAGSIYLLILIRLPVVLCGLVVMFSDDGVCCGTSPQSQPTCWRSAQWAGSKLP